MDQARMWLVTLLQLCAISLLVVANETVSSRTFDGHRSAKYVLGEKHPLSEEFLGNKEHESDVNDEAGYKPKASIGRWWKNGQALEPKWRDGDHVPLTPFHSSHKIIDDLEDVATFQSRQKLRSSQLPKKPTDHLSENVDNDFSNSEPRLSRRRKPPQLPEDELRELEEKQLPKFPYESPEGAAIRYRETFQNRPSEYELNDDEYQKPRPRKRRPPQNHEFAEVKMSYSNYQPEHTPMMVHKFQENSELKTLLKKQQGKDLSLSEILQRSNLTLSDLLQGKANVIDLLKTHNKEEYKDDEQQPSWIQNQQNVPEYVPSNVVVTEVTTSEKVPTISENPTETTTTVKNVDTDFPDALQIEEVKKKSDPGAMDNLDEDEIMEFSDFTMKSTTDEAHTVKMEPTLSTEHVLSPETGTTVKSSDFEDLESEKEPVVPEQVDLMELEYQNDGPQEDTKDYIPEFMENKTPKNHRKETNNYEDIVSKIEPEARAEIFELFSSGSSAKRLERLLKSRNMSIDELIALRQRGSSQVHLAEVSKHRHQKILDSKKQKQQSSESAMKKKEEMESLMDNIADEQRLETQESRLPVSETIAPPLEESSSKAREILDIYTAFDSLPIARNIKEQYNKIEDGLTKMENRSMSFIEVGRVEEILDENLGSSNDIYEISRTEIDHENKTLSKVKSSIIASGAIFGVTLVVFLTIFIVCRIQQRQKYTYRNTFSRAVFQSPAMAARKLSNSSSLNTIMVNVVATSNTKRSEDCDAKSEIENDSLDGNDSWDTIPDYMK